MLKKFMRVMLGVFGAVIGFEFVKNSRFATEFTEPFWGNLDRFLTSNEFIVIIAGFLLGFFLISYLLEKLLELVLNFEYRLKEISGRKFIVGITGLIIGILFGILVNSAFPFLKNHPALNPIYYLINLVFGYLGFSFFIHKEKEIIGLFTDNKKRVRYEGLYDNLSNKILDTSVIIDGRIADICKTGFVEGTLIIPEFILEELRHIADSSDVLKRNRGRRGLDILKQMQKDPNINVEIITQDFEDIQEVDSKLVKLAQIMDAKIVTNDYNLNKVAELQGIFVLNINELANAVKPIVLPGEEMDVKVIKEGKEDGQGVGYLDDGTMIVVDDGVNYMGKKVSVMVTSILQTAAGRMIFAKPKAREQII
ncbi:MAG: hypothetical protein PWR10_2421 [Halanaerobiales bacterium]|nr:hypothetical protein [Halanaerobiales bacterium]